ncbi:serine/threonine-protein kinase Nek1 isoform X2 [Hippocampus comes]|uniref:serine/threonine-protein kinase Nek1 isoform X2 n=1 Tax=Hippocampus comes TaxID=109280 RepID=UPI00094E8CF7|nr:PREDICTED: serine/threonine-protein kinase Nek1 isoform X2 [Hippocampus comes]
MDKYDQVKKIGEGSFGKAVLVKAKKDGHQYVIKEVSISGMSDKERHESRKEVAVLANMSHPNIVQYKESFEEGGCLYIVMDYCEGGDLFKKINSQRGMLFTEEQILDWFVQICLALKHIHDRKILHRDIKSQNIFLTKDGTVQLGDFGIARVLNSTVELARTCIGTPYYLSPEICENKPYNNKSDIWALGCVLYEMCTLKHAFEAGNMKNLVLKIIRGSYHPVSLHYSQELRSLLAQLFKHNPRERPSVRAILDKPFLSCRIQRFLTPKVIAQEFHPTFIHKQHKVGVHQGSVAKHPASGSIPSPAAKITTPACKYGVPLTARKVSVTKKHADRKPAIKHKPALASIHRRVSQGEEGRRKQEIIKKRRMELIDKEKLREQINRINHAREQGWKNDLMSSIGSPERKCYLGGGKRTAVFGPCPVPSFTPVSVMSRNPYEHAHSALDEIAKQQSSEVGISREGSAEPGTLIRNVPAAAGPVLPNGPAPLINPDAVKRELQRLQHNSKQTHMSRRKSHIPVERAYQVEEFLQRKREAMLNKVRAEGQLGKQGTQQYGAAIYEGQVGSAWFTRPQVNKEEEEYLTRLRQIRLQNFNERQQIKARLRGEKYDSDGSDSQESSEEAKLRRKKMVASKAQANARAALLKEQLERKRREANEREKKAWDDHIAAQEDSVCMAAVPPTSQPTIVKTSSALPESEPPTPVISMTVALNNVGASEKKQILNRLNQNLKAPSPVDEVLESAPTAPKEEILASQQKLLETESLPSIEERKKWDPAELPVLPTSQPTLKEFCTTASRDRPPSGGDRKKWDEGLPFVFSVAQQTLEETCIPTIEQTVGEVVQMGVLQGEGQRKLWGVIPDCQILKVLHEAEVQPLTQLLETVSVCEEASPSPDEPNQIVAEHEMSTPEEDMSSKDGTPAVIEVQVQMEYVATTEVSHPENASEIEGHTKPSSIAEIQDPEDVESMVLEDVPKASHTSMELHHAWEKQDQPPLLPEVNTNQGAAAGKEGVSQGEEPLLMKLCSPAHRRTSALVLFSAQSSVDESSSSLASRSRSVSPMRSKQHNALLIGLSTGLFDANNPKMLRTCSLPDLSRVFSAEKDFVITTEDSIAPDGNQGNEDQDEGKDDDQSDAYEDEDLRDIRASMEQLLQEENDFMRNRPHDGRGDFNGNATVAEDKYFFNRIIVELEQQNDQMTVADDDDDDVQDDDEDGEDEDEECLNGSPVEEEAGALLSNGVREETHTNKSQFNEEWQSDNSEEDREGESHLYDSIYSRLEEHRFNLEQQMGFEKFIEAYNKIKAIRDADDDNIDLGSSLAFSILGNEHQHLYPNILHLVMADGAYQEGNDKRFEQWSHW